MVNRKKQTGAPTTKELPDERRHEERRDREYKPRLSPFGRSLRCLPPDLIIQRTETSDKLACMISEGFRGIPWYLHQIAASLNKVTEAHLYLLRGTQLTHAAGIELDRKGYLPLFLDAEYDVRDVLHQNPETLPLTGTEGEEMSYVFVDRRDQHVFSTVIGDLECESFRLPRDTGRQRFLAPLYVREKSGLVQMGVLDLIGSDVLFGNFVPKNNEQREALVAMTLQMIATLSRIISRLVQAKTDTLTALPLRREGTERLIEAIEYFKRGKIDDFTAIEADIDHFKNVNDRHGHSAGDGVLQAFASALSNTFRTKPTSQRKTDQRKKVNTLQDSISRDGGEEFRGVIISGIAGTKAAVGRAMKNTDELRIPVDGDDTVTITATYGAVSITQLISAGLISIRDSTDHIVTVMKSEADRLLYAGKKAGRNRVVCFGEQ